MEGNCQVFSTAVTKSRSNSPTEPMNIQQPVEETNSISSPQQLVVSPSSVSRLNTEEGIPRDSSNLESVPHVKEPTDCLTSPEKQQGIEEPIDSLASHEESRVQKESAPLTTTQQGLSIENQDASQSPQASPQGSNTESGSKDSSATDSQSNFKGGLSTEGSQPFGDREIPLLISAEDDLALTSKPSEQDTTEDKLIAAEDDFAPTIKPSEQEIAKDIKNVLRDQNEPELSMIPAELPALARANTETVGQEPKDTSIEATTTEIASNQCTTVHHETVHLTTGAPPEYYFNIPKKEFFHWKVTKNYSNGLLKFDTEISILSGITPPNNQLRETNVMIHLKVKNYDRNSEYEGKGRVTLYDENAGHIIANRKEKRKFEEGLDYVKFLVNIGAEREIEKRKSKKLQLQVKVQVSRSRNYTTHWEVISE